MVKDHGYGLNPQCAHPSNGMGTHITRGRVSNPRHRHLKFTQQRFTHRQSEMYIQTDFS
jgi:hypothetical protein